MTIPALRELRRVFSGARITVWTKPQLSGLYQESQLVDHLLTAPPSSLFDTVRQLKSGAFDVAVLFQNAFRAALLVFVARIPVRCGYSTDGRRILLTHPVAVDLALRRQHQVFSYLHLVAALERFFRGRTEVDFEMPNQALPTAQRRVERGLAFLGRWGVDLGKSLVVVNPGATNSRAKRWLPERFAGLSDRLLERGDTSVVFIGAEEEIDLARQIAARMRQEPILLTGKTDLKQLVDVLSCAQLLISNDTGPAHLGPAVGAPTLVIFGPTEHFATRPFSENAKIIRRSVACSPCMLRDCPIDHRCMIGITVSDLFAEAVNLLEAVKSGCRSAAEY